MSETTKSRVRFALVTGAARRIGACIAETLHQRGCDVFLHYHNSDVEVKQLADRLNALRPASATVVQADLGVTEDIERLAEHVRARAGQLYLLVNNASKFFPTAVGSTTMTQWDELMDSNLRGPYFLTQALLPELTIAGGSVINLLDVHASRPMHQHAVYCMAKAGLQMMTLALAKDLGPQIRVNGIAPGVVDSDMWDEVDALFAKYENRPKGEKKRLVGESVPYGRMGKPEDLTGMAVFLASADAAYVVAQTYNVDGGNWMN